MLCRYGVGRADGGGGGGGVSNDGVESVEVVDRVWRDGEGGDVECRTCRCLERRWRFRLRLRFSLSVNVNVKVRLQCGCLHPMWRKVLGSHIFLNNGWSGKGRCCMVLRL
jgi:hypothetical protein